MRRWMLTGRRELRLVNNRRHKHHSLFGHRLCRDRAIDLYDERGGVSGVELVEQWCVDRIGVWYLRGTRRRPVVDR